MSRIPIKKRFMSAAAVTLIIFCAIYLFCFYFVYYVSKKCEDLLPFKPIGFKENELLNLTNFRYVLQPTDAICGSDTKELNAIIVITSAAGNEKIRSYHRAAISNENLRKMKMIRVFSLGADLTHSRIVTQKAVKAEYEKFNDIVQGNFMDSYHNLTYKNIMGLRWASTHPCLKTNYIIRADDDIVVDYFHMMRHLLKNHYDRWQHNKTEYFMAGMVNSGMVPVRTPSKWQVKVEEYAASFYPDYLTGWCMVTTPHTARKLISAFDQTTQIFWIEDMWITGILREIADIPLSPILNEFYTYHIELLECCLIDIKKSKLGCPLMVGPNVWNERLVEQFVQGAHTHCYNMSSDIMNDLCTERDFKSVEKSCCLRYNYGFCKLKKF